jgi:hypothetical protein
LHLAGTATLVFRLSTSFLGGIVTAGIDLNLLTHLILKGVRPLKSGQGGGEISENSTSLIDARFTESVEYAL